jgi:hypothetical protein
MEQDKIASQKETINRMMGYYIMGLKIPLYEGN